MAPLGGGGYTAMNKVLPGMYTNFVSLSSIASIGETGTAALPLCFDWAPDGEVFAVEAADFSQTALSRFAYEAISPELLYPREALKRARTLLCYRLNSGGQRAAATVGSLPVTAKYSGVRGNDIAVAVIESVDDPQNVEVATYLDAQKVDSQIVAAEGGASALTANNYVDFGTAATLEPAAAQRLAGGTNGTVTGQSHADALAALEKEAFSAIGCIGGDPAIKALYDAFVRRLRDDVGMKIKGVIAAHPGDHIGLINVKNGVKLADGTILPAQKAVAWVTGATAAAAINQSLTGDRYEGAVDVDERFTVRQYENALRGGEFAFYAEDGSARVLSDINSLVSVSTKMSEDWKSNRVVRVMDSWAMDSARIFGERYLGSSTNNDTQRGLFKGDLVSLAVQYQGLEAIEGFSPDDIIVEQGQKKREVVLKTGLAVNDSMEVIYQEVIVR